MKSIKELFIKKIPTKNYYIVVVVSILVILISLYARSFYLNYKENTKNSSPFYDKTINQINTNDLDYALSESNEVILYVSYTGNEKVYNNEKRLFREANKKNLSNKIIYWDVTSIYKNNQYLNILREKYPSKASLINNAPLLMYIKDGEVKEVISSDFLLVDYENFNYLVNKYEIE